MIIDDFNGLVEKIKDKHKITFSTAEYSDMYYGNNLGNFFQNFTIFNQNIQIISTECGLVLFECSDEGKVSIHFSSDEELKLFTMTYT